MEAFLRRDRNVYDPRVAVSLGGRDGEFFSFLYMQLSRIGVFCGISPCRPLRFSIFSLCLLVLEQTVGADEEASPELHSFCWNFPYKGIVYRRIDMDWIPFLQKNIKQATAFLSPSLLSV